MSKGLRQCLRVRVIFVRQTWNVLWKALKSVGAAVTRVVIVGSKIEFILERADEGSAENEPLDKWMAAHADATERH